MAPFKEFEKYPGYMLAILMYQGYPLCHENLKALMALEALAFKPLVAGDAYINPKHIEATVFDWVVYNGHDVHDRLAKATAKEGAEHRGALVVMAVQNGCPAFLRTPEGISQLASRPFMGNKLWLSLFPWRMPYQWTCDPSKASMFFGHIDGQICLSYLKHFEAGLIFPTHKGAKIVPVPN